MSKPEIFYQLFSPPARTAYFVAKEIGLNFVEREVNLMQGETSSPEYREMNVTGTVPTLKDGDITVFDSHAISIYLVEKYAKNDSLYPKNDLALRTKINQVLFYEASYLYPKLAQITVPIYFFGEKPTADKIAAVERGYGCVESFLKDTKYVAGNQMTLADFSVWSLLESIVKLVNCDPAKFPKIIAYLERLREQFPEYSGIMVKSIKAHLEFIDSCYALPLSKRVPPSK